MHEGTLGRLQKLMARMFTDNEAEQAVAARAFVEASRKAGIHPSDLTLVHDADLLGRLTRLTKDMSDRNEVLEAENAAWRKVAPEALRRRVAEMKKPHFKRWQRLEFLCRRAYGKYWRRGLCRHFGMQPAELKAIRRGERMVGDDLVRQLEALPPHRPRRRVVWDDWMLNRLQTLSEMGQSASEIAEKFGIPVGSVKWRLRQTDGGEMRAAE